MESIELIKKKIAELEEARRMAEINMHRADAAIWALKSVLEEAKTGNQEQPNEEGKSGDNK